MSTTELAAKPSINRSQIAKGILEAASESNLPSGQQRRLERAINAPWYRPRLVRKGDLIIDQAIEALIEAQKLVATPEGVEAAADWMAIIQFIKEFLPVLLQILDLFGG